MTRSPALPLVGRRAETDALDTALAGLEQGEPRAVQIVGPAGIGKSRLLAELTARAERRGHLVLDGASSELEQDLPFWAFVDALDDYVEGLDPRRLERLGARVRSELGQVLPSLAADPAATDTAIHERYRIHRAMRELLERLAATKPLVLVLDDLHWADAASVDLLLTLLHRPPTAGVMVAMAARPRQLAPRLATALQRAQRAGMLTALELQPLTAEEARALVGPAAERIYLDSGGNPFYLEQLARAPGAAGGDGLSLPGLKLPAAVVASLGDELAALDASARRVLDGAAVAGDPFEIDLAAVAADLPEPAVLDALDELARLEFVHATDLPRRFRFRHPIVRRALYETTPDGWRIGAHARVAQALAERGAPATARAHHVERSARHGDGAAIATLREAGEQTRHRSPVTAARWFTAALGLLPGTATVQDRVALLLPAAQAQAATGAFRESHATLLEILDALPRASVAQWVEVSTWCARIEHLLGRHEEAHARLLSTLDAIPDEDSDEGLSVLIELALDGLNRMDYRSMRGWAQRAIAAADHRGDPLLLAAGAAAAARGLAFSGATAEAGPVCDRAAALVDGLSDAELARRLDAIAHLAGAELYLHRFADALRHAQRALAVGRATGQHQLFPVVFAILAMTWMFLGALEEAVDPLEGNVEAARLSGNAQTISWSLYGLAKVAIAAGDLERAISAAQVAVDVVGGDYDKPSHHVVYAAFALGEAQLLAGRPERALPLLERAGGPDMALVADSWRAYWLELLTRCRLAPGDRAAAERAAQLADASARSVELPLARAWADRAAAAVALDAGDAPRAARLALASAATADGAGGRIEAALSRLLAGRALARAEDRAAAIEQTQRAAALFAEVGAERYRDAAERELRQLGQRVPRRPQRTVAAGEGLETLTPRELEIARLIVDRRTNRQIAEELFLSPKTVETHIRNLFAKLGVDSRVEVARVVERADRRAAS